MPFTAKTYLSCIRRKATKVVLSGRAQRITGVFGPVKRQFYPFTICLLLQLVTVLNGHALLVRG
jgi:hypothetical protein